MPQGQPQGHCLCDAMVAGWPREGHGAACRGRDCRAAERVILMCEAVERQQVHWTRLWNSSGVIPSKEIAGGLLGRRCGEAVHRRIGLPREQVGGTAVWDVALDEAVEEALGASPWTEVARGLLPWMRPRVSLRGRAHATGVGPPPWSRPWNGSMGYHHG